MHSRKPHPQESAVRVDLNFDLPPGRKEIVVVISESLTTVDSIKGLLHYKVAGEFAWQQHRKDKAMIISKTPFRVPFAGGLSDLPAYAHRFSGVTVSSTIDKYVYVGIKRNVDGYINLKYMDVHEKVKAAEDVRHDLIREALYMMELNNEPLDVYIMVDLNSESGLGSSGAVTVGLLNAMHAYKEEAVEPLKLFEEAARIEVQNLGNASGYHDPAISALGGLKLIEYDANGIDSRPISIGDRFKEEFQESLLFFYTGRHYKSKPSLDLLTSHMDGALETLGEMKRNAWTLAEAFTQANLRAVSRGIAVQQELKQKLPGKFSDQYVEDVVSRARKHGAGIQLPGGKIGAFLMVCCPDGQQAAIREEFKAFREVQLALSDHGSTVIEV